MPELYLKRTLQGFAPDDDESREACRRIPVGTTVRCDISRPRSLPQLRYYWALCSLVAINHQQLETREMVDQALRILTGHVDLVQIGENTVKIPRRIAFAKLSQDEWQTYLLRAKDIVVRELLPGVEMREVEDEIMRMVQS